MGTLSGAYRQFDYYSAFGRTDTQNSYPNSAFHNATYAGNFGWAPNTANDGLTVADGSTEPPAPSF